MEKRRLFSKFCIVLFTCMLILPYSSKDACSAAWKLYFKGEDGLLYFYDLLSINYLPNNVIRVFTKNMADDEEGRIKEITNRLKADRTFPINWAYTMDLWEIDCKNRTSVPLAFTMFNTDNEVLEAITFKNLSFNYIVPETMMEALYKAVCTKTDLKKKKR